MTVGEDYPMKNYPALWLIPAAILILSACTGPTNPLAEYNPVTPPTALTVPTPDPARASAYDADTVERGQYLVELLGCASCHTDGALLGRPSEGAHLSGSNIGIAYTNPLASANPGVVYPGNLTPDKATGLGDWSDDDIVAVLMRGEGRSGHRLLPVMPWTAYNRLHEKDAYAIAVYLHSLPAVKHEVPDNVTPGRKAGTPYVHVGLYYRKD